MSEAELKPSPCPNFCLLGYKGMDRCGCCHGTASVFRVNDKTFPNTEQGYEKAVEAQKAKQP